MASLAERLYPAPAAAPSRNRFAAIPDTVTPMSGPMNGQAPLANLQPGQFTNNGSAFQGVNSSKNYVTDVWTPPKLDANGHFTSQQDIDDFKAAFGNTGVTSAGMSEHQTPLGFNVDATAQANNKAAGEWAQQNGFWTPPAGGHGGVRGALGFIGEGLKNIVLTPPVLAALTAGAGAALGAGAGAAAGADAGAEGIAAGQAAGLTTDQLLAQSAAGLSIATPAETAVALGAGTEVAAGAAGAGAGAQFGGSVQSAAAPVDAGGTGGGSKGAAAYLSTAKDIAGLALTGLGLGAAIGAVGPGASQAPPDATAPPQDQVSSVDQQGVAQADNAGQRFPNLGGSGDDTLFNGASGIDPFMLNLGRAKLLGQ